MKTADRPTHMIGESLSDGPQASMATFIPYSLLTVLVIILPMCWLQVARVAGMTLRPSHLLLVVMGIAILPNVATVEIQSLRIRQLVSFSTFYAIYFAVMVFGIFRPESTGRSLAFVARLGVYFGFFLLLTELILKVSPALLVRSIYYGSLLGTALFLIVAIFVFARMGRNLPVEYFRALATGDVVKLRCGFYPILLNFSGDTVSSSDEDAIMASFRHGICTSFFCYFFLVSAFRPLAKRVLGSRLANGVFYFVAGMSLFIMVTSVSRSTIVALAAALLTTLCLVFARGQLRMPGPGICLILMGLVVCGATAVAFDPSLVGKMTEAFHSRFLELHENPRVGMFRETLYRSHDSWLWGNGIGAPITRRGQQVHNVVLGALYEGGVFAMVAAFLFYTSLLLAWLSMVISHARYGLESRRGVAWHWLLVIPCLPLLTAMVSGASGSFRLNDWVCLSFFFASLGLFLHRRDDVAPAEATGVMGVGS